MNHLHRLRRAVGCLLAVLFIISVLPISASAYTDKGKIVVLLDPGHSDGDGGGTYAGDHLECWYNMRVALACKEVLEKNGNFVVYLSHPDNKTAATLLERAQKADSVNADVIISMHFDGGETAGMNGAEVFTSVLPEYNLDTLANKIMNQLTTKTELAWRGVYQRGDTGDGVNVYYWNRDKKWDVPNNRKAGPLSDYYGIITWGAKYGIPALIIEHGFMTNDHDREIAESEENLKLMGQADAAAIIDYYTNHTHKWSQNRQTDYPTNCCFAGKASYHCSVCGARKGTVTLASPTEDDHYYVVTAYRERTCTQDGYTTYTCRIAHNLTEKGCDVGEHTYTVHEYATGHNYVVTEDREVTHLIDGVHTETCTRCGDKKTTVTKAEGHTWVFDTRIEPTCTEPGCDRMVCTVCGEHTGMNPTPAVGHHYEVTEDSAPSCTEDGVHTEVCTLCGDTVTETYPAFGHSYAETERKEPLCEEDGFFTMCCETCGDCYTEVLPAVGHDFSSSHVQTEPAFFKKGLLIRVCANDPLHTQEEILPRTSTDTELRLAIAGILAGALLLFAGLLLLILLIRRRRKRRAAEAADADTVYMPLSEPIPEASGSAEPEAPSETISPSETAMTAEPKTTE